MSERSAPAADPAAPADDDLPVAAVVVNTPVSRAGGYSSAADIFSYEIPDALRTRVRPGHLVWVPFAGRRLQGVVVSLQADAPPGVTLRPLESLVYDEPQLLPGQIRLAEWMSQRYLAPLRDCLLVMLPGGVAQRVDVVLSRQGGGPLPDDLNAEQRGLLERLQRGDAAQRLLKRENAAWTSRAVLQPLLKRGLIVRHNAVTTPRARARTELVARLLRAPAESADILATLGRASKQADALAMLARHDPPTLSIDALCKLAACSRGPIQALAARGWVTLTPRQAGEPASVRLAIPRAEVAGRQIELRGGEKYQRVVEALAAAGEPLSSGRLTVLAATDLNTLRRLEQAGVIALEEVEVLRDPLAGRDFGRDRPPALTQDQEMAREAIEVAMRSQRAQAAEAAGQAESRGRENRFFLLHGVTGSGKTEIYLRAIETALHHGQEAIVLVPEIALTPQTINRFAGRFPGRVAVWHSDLSAGERYDTWRRMRRGELPVVVGPRSALFAPYANLGVIVVDEEHDGSYKEHERAPTYQARSVAMRLGQLTGATVILGSATPSLETYYWAQRGQMQLITLPRRIMGHRQAIERQAVTWGVHDSRYRPLDLALPDVQTIDLPEVQVVDMRQELRTGHRSLLSRPLQEAIGRTLDADEQAILFLNRRGNATVVMCRDCGHVEQCTRCDLPFTYHGPLNRSSAGPEPYLLCHHCNRRRPVPQICSNCGSLRIRHLGAGTQRIEQLVNDLYPQARTLRWDRDTTQRKGSHEVIMRRFASHEANVLIGTQMIAKGLDLPLVTLVGVVSADMGLYLPDFRAAEQTFQLLTQVSGRAGRGLRGGRVIVQTYTPDHYAIRAASQHDYLTFYSRELAYRREFDYPPFTRLVRLIFSHSNLKQAESEAQRVAGMVQAEIRRLGLPGIALAGPAPCFIGRLRYRYRWHIVVRGRGSDPSEVVRGLELPFGWRVDVDPVNLL